MRLHLGSGVHQGHLLAVVLLVVCAGVTAAQTSPPPEQGGEAFTAAASAADLADLSLEELMNVEITSAARHPQRISQAAAAVTVISQDDIRRSGLTSIPELLRLSPGLQVARINANAWAIGSRGFNDLFQNKLLVLMDGRTLYNPSFSGVFWEAQDYLLEDLERIEVIRGPGATLWGANAVNGVINVTTKTARDTQGWFVTGHASNLERIGGIRYGGRIDDDTHYRVYTKYRTTDDFHDPASPGGQAFDGWDDVRGGFRIDRRASAADTLTLQGDAFSQRLGQTRKAPALAPPFTVPTQEVANAGGGYLLARWTHVASPDSDFILQGYYDRYQRHEPILGYDQDTWDVDFQHRFRLGRRQEVVWGAGFRYLVDRFEGLTPVLRTDTSHQDHYVASAFVQDDVTIVPDRLHLILGSKFEQNSHTGFEVQPNLRVLWTPDDRQTVWGSVSRATRTPSRFEETADLTVATFPTGPTGPVGQLGLIGNDRLDAEELLAFEAGYRVRPTPTVSIDLAGFYNRYDRLRGLRSLPPAFNPVPPPAVVVLDQQVANVMDGHSYGAEAAVTWQATEQLRLVGSYTWLDVDLRGGVAEDRQYFENSSPRHQAQLRSYLTVTRDLELNAALYYAERLRTNDVPSLLRLDLNVTWRPTPDLELTAGVQNLLDDYHAEFTDSHVALRRSEVPRTLFVQLTCRF
jgi:iron complex outermembrane receptor protein